MANFSKIKSTQSFPLEIEIHPYLMDHRFDGNAVFPAVEAMQMLAASTQSNIPEMEPECIQHATFDKFLVLKEEKGKIEVFNEIALYKDGSIISKLVTRNKSKQLAITRLKEHVILCFHSHQDLEMTLPLFEELINLEGEQFQIPSSTVYQELVPFGPSYHNIIGDLRISSQGVIANLSAPASEAKTKPLGSPFPLDAAFHASCVWCQCFLGFIGFPVGFEKRTIVNQTTPGNEYTSRMIPKKINPELLICDLWILNHEGKPFEIISGLKMRDVSGGRIKPPEWVMNSAHP